MHDIHTHKRAQAFGEGGMAFNPNALKSELQNSGLKWLSYGVGAAAVMKLLSDRRESARRREDAMGVNPSGENVIRVPIGGKAAGLKDSVAGFASGVRDAASGAAGGAAKWIKSQPGVPFISKDENSDYALGATWKLMSTAGPALLGYYALDRFFKNREREQLSEELEGAKRRYADLLMADVDPSRGKSAMAEFPAVMGAVEAIAGGLQDADGICRDEPKSANGPNGLSYITSIPGLAFTIAGLAAHRFALEREKGLDRLHNKVHRQPFKPTRIELYSVGGQEEEKRASMPLLVGLQGLRLATDTNSSFLGRDTSDEIAAALEHERERQEDAARETPIGMVDRNTATVNTPMGQFTVDAADPESAALLRKRRKRIIEALSTVPSP